MPAGTKLPMGKFGPPFFRIVFTFLAVAMLACGNGNGQLQSVTVSPAVASGNVQFTATGIYTDGSRVSPLTALWTINNPWVVAPSPPVPGGVSVSSTGLAQCTGFTGTGYSLRHCAD